MPLPMPWVRQANFLNIAYTQTTQTMSNSNELVKPYPKTFSHIGITVPDIEEAVKFNT